MPMWASKAYQKRTQKNKFLITNYQKIVSDFLHSIDANTNKLIIDVGTGPGAIPIELAEGNTQIKVIGVDISPNMVQLAEKVSVEEGLSDRVEFKVGNALELPYEDNQFDYVISSFSLHEWPEPEKGIIDMLRILKKSGKLFIYDMNPHLNSNLKKELRKEYGFFSVLYFNRISKSFRKTVEMLQEFLEEAKGNNNYKMEIEKELAKMVFEKK